MVGFSTSPQKETDWRPGCVQGVKKMEINSKSCLIINHNENRVLTAQVALGTTWTIAARKPKTQLQHYRCFFEVLFTFRRRRRPPHPLRLPQLYPTSIRSGCLAIAGRWKHKINKTGKKFHLHDERAVFIAVLIQGVQLSNSVVKCLKKDRNCPDKNALWDRNTRQERCSQILSSKATIISQNKRWL